MKIPTLTYLAISIAAMTEPVFAQVAPHQLILTETSSTSLAATYDNSTAGVSINFISGDHWGVTVSNVTFTGTPQWTELEDPSTFNVITLLAPPGQFIVNSDYLNNGTPPLTDGSPFNNFGTDSRDGGSISVTFRDRGDVAAAVPDTGSTVALLSLSLIALIGLGRVRSRQSA
ncbi:MAG TPA: VPDSG-CTERM sorting domain-containing protein [Chthoniobacterales bacterium]|nr:VPDSG-CTERM sorting domain-containing protein [Chthoniobacterales bacterium]